MFHTAQQQQNLKKKKKTMMEEQENPRNQLLSTYLDLDAIIDIVSNTKINLMQSLPSNKSQFNQRIRHFNRKIMICGKNSIRCCWVSKERNITSHVEDSKSFNEKMVVEIGLRMMCSFHN